MGLTKLGDSPACLALLGRKTSHLFGLWINPWQSECERFFPLFKEYFVPGRDPEAAVGGELMLGGANPEHYTGQLHYVSVTRQSYWQIQVNG